MLKSPVLYAKRMERLHIISGAVLTSVFANCFIRNALLRLARKFFSTAPIAFDAPEGSIASRTI